MTGRGAAGRQPGPPYLLDTHIWFWYVVASARLPQRLRTGLEPATGELWLSPISVWKLALLEQRGLVRLASGARPRVSGPTTSRRPNSRCAPDRSSLAISRLERGAVSPTFETFERLLAVMGEEGWCAAATVTTTEHGWRLCAHDP